MNNLFLTVMSPMNPTEAMRIFVRVAEQASFTRAADSLGASKAGVSMVIQELETTLGTRLLHRTTRKVQLTQDGMIYYERCKSMLAELDELQSMFQQDRRSLRGRLRVDMPTGIARLHLIPQLPRLLEAHPQLEIELSCTDRLVDPIQEGFDCVLRAGVLRDTPLIARPLGTLTAINCASPAYLRRYGTPRTLADLEGHRLIHYATTLGASREGFEHPSPRGYRSLAMPGALVVNSSEAYNAACLAGLGLIQAPLIGVRHYLDQGALVEVLPDLRPQPLPLSLLFAHRRNLPQRVRVFMDWVAETLKPYLDE